MAFGTIESVSVAAEDFQQRWGVQVYTYNLSSTGVDGVTTTTPTDFEGLLVKISTNRATTIEAEIKPVSVQVEARNNELDKLGGTLSTLTGMQALFKSDDPGTKSSQDYSTTIYLTDEQVASINELYQESGQTGSIASKYMSKANVETAIQLVKTKMDSLNNESQEDMTRLQSLVDKRDESYSTASSLMSSVSDTRGNSIKNM